MKNNSVIITTSLPYLGNYFIKEVSKITDIEFIIIQKNKLSFYNFLKKIIYDSILNFLINRTIHYKDFKIYNPIRRNKFLLNFCKKKKIKLIYTKNINEDLKIYSMLRNSNSNFILNLGGSIIRKNLIKISKATWINGHGGILPNYRGLCSEYWAIFKGDLDKIGVTIHILTDKIDQGDIIYTSYIKYKKVPLYLIEFENHINLISSYLKALKIILVNDSFKLYSFDESKSNYYSVPLNYNFKRFNILK